MNHPGDIPIAEEHVKDVDEIHKWWVIILN